MCGMSLFLNLYSLVFPNVHKLTYGLLSGSCYSAIYVYAYLKLRCLEFRDFCQQKLTYPLQSRILRYR